jgi:hypothetical protein
LRQIFFTEVAHGGIADGKDIHLFVVLGKRKEYYAKQQ